MKFSKREGLNDLIILDEIQEKTAIIPVPVPIYVPSPMWMFSMPFPVPFPFPLPVPVPIFIPTTRNSASGIMKEIKVSSFILYLSVQLILGFY